LLRKIPGGFCRFKYSSRDDLELSHDWLLDHAFLLVPAQQLIGQFLDTFKAFPPRQKAASFSIDQMLDKYRSQLAEAAA
jgi:hypothetical protein